jgi:predicted DCC family thiol-disulfide oxidoreductase YuxK
VASVILFDGVCNLCNGLVRFIIARDLAGRFQFAALQSLAATRLLSGRRLPDDAGDTIILLEGDRISTQSTAALRIARGLRAPWNLAYAAIVIPRPLRDAIYRWVARNRYRWFGKRDECVVPTPAQRARFLDE